MSTNDPPSILEVPDRHKTQTPSGVDKLVRYCRESWFRIQAASKLDFSTNLLSVVSKVFQIGYVLSFGLAKYSQTTSSIINDGKWLFRMFVVAIVYSTIYPFFPRSRKTKWINEEIKRVQSLSVAIARLAAGIGDESLTDTDFLQILHGILVAMKSEVETIVSDAEGLYINVNLLIEDPNDSDKLRVICRANPTRKSNVSYPKEEMIVWAAMKSKQWQYEPDFSSNEHSPKPYKTILAFPVNVDDAGGSEKTVGGISIDSARARHFDGLIEKMEIKMLPYLQLIALALRTREKRGSNRVRIGSKSSR